MELKNYRKQFETALKDLYPQTEIQAIFGLLSAHILRLNSIEMALQPNRVLSASELQLFQSAITRLLAHEPIQYIIGSTEFFGLPLIVNEAVLIPRQETEELVAWILEENKHDRPLNILEIGTGSGCIAISLAKNLPHATVWALDVSKKALTLARQNAEHNKVELHFLLQDILTSPDFGTQQFDLIVSNPPYVRDLERAEINDNVLRYEPHLALFVTDHDPLLFYEAMITVAHNHLKDAGKMYAEINQYLGTETKALFVENGYESTLKKDLNNNDRMISATKTTAD